MASIKDVANLSRVSVATVSHVVNNTRFVSDKTRQRVLDAMSDLHYVTNPVARSLRTSRMETIGLLIPYLSSPFYTEVAEGIEAVLQANGYNLLLCNTKDDVEIEKKHIAMLSSGMVSGIIVAAVGAHGNYRSFLSDPAFPLVMVDRKVEETRADSVLIDDRKITCEVIEHLIAKGHSKIGFIMGKDGVATSESRLQGYLDAYSKTGLPMADDWVQHSSSHSETSGYDRARLLVEKADVTAIFASNSLVTLEAFQFLLQHQISVPAQIALTGFGDYDWTTITTPPLSVIRMPTRQMGEKAAELILDKIHHPEGPYVEVNLQAEFIKRSSC